MFHCVNIHLSILLLVDIRFVSDFLLSVLLHTFLDISPGACADEIHNMSTVHPVKVKAVQNAALMSGHIKTRPREPASRSHSRVTSAHDAHLTCHFLIQLTDITDPVPGSGDKSGDQNRLCPHPHALIFLKRETDIYIVKVSLLLSPCGFFFVFGHRISFLVGSSLF